MRAIRALWATIRILAMPPLILGVIPYIIGALLSIFVPVLRGDSVLMWAVGLVVLVTGVVGGIVFWVNYAAEER